MRVAPCLKNTSRAEMMIKNVANTFTAIIFAVVVVILFKWNPLDYFLEAGSPAYYQARVAFERGDSGERSTIRLVMKGGNISMRDYSDMVFPAYQKTLPPGLNSPFPDSEAQKSKEQLRSELVSLMHKT